MRVASLDSGVKSNEDTMDSWLMPKGGEPYIKTLNVSGTGKSIGKSAFYRTEITLKEMTLI